MMPDSSSMKKLYLRKIVPLLFICGLILAISSCDSGQHPPIPVAKMSNILFDLQTAEDYSIGRFSDSIQHGAEKNPDTLAYYYAMVLKHHQLSVEELKQAMDWYFAHPQIMDSVYKQVIVKANKYKGTDIPQTAPILEEPETEGVQTDSIVRDPEPAAKAPQLDRPERSTVAPVDRTEDEELKEIRRKNKDIKATLDKVKKQAQ